MGKCGICDLSEGEHTTLEGQGILNHKYSELGNLEAVERPGRAPARPFPTVVGAYDLELRQILLNKGIINNEDFAALRHPGAGTAGDREAGETPSSE